MVTDVMRCCAMAKLSAFEPNQSKMNCMKIYCTCKVPHKSPSYTCRFKESIKKGENTHTHTQADTQSSLGDYWNAFVVKQLLECDVHGSFSHRILMY